MKQITLFDKGILQRQQSKKYEVTLKKKKDFVEYWSEIHKDTNWNEVSYDLKHGKKSDKRLLFKLIGTEEPKELCGKFVKEGCVNFEEHPTHLAYGQNKRLTCKSPSCSVCWDSWLIREASRGTERIEKFRMLGEKNGFRSTKPIHVVVSPPKWLWNVSWTEMKKNLRRMVKRAGIVGGIFIFHAYRLSKKDGKTWFYSPHFHMVGFGWVIDTKKIQSNEGWVIKNLGIRKTSTEVYSTLAYQLSHTAIAKDIHSVTWVGELSYRSKYALELKREIIESEAHKCPYCSQYLVLIKIRGSDRPPPDEEWYGLFEPYRVEVVETIEQMLDRKFWLKKKLENEYNDSSSYWNDECKKSWDKAESLKKLTNATSTDTATTV